MKAFSMAPSPFEGPPQELKNAFKKYRTTSLKDLEHLTSNEVLIDLKKGIAHKFTVTSQTIPVNIFQSFLGASTLDVEPFTRIYTSAAVPGLQVLPDLLPPSVQRGMLSRLMHRDLSIPKHQTNLHFHHNLRYPSNEASFFSHSSATILADPKDSTLHQSLSVDQVLHKKLRWLTLGGQYDWTNKVYPDQDPPRFPEDLANLINGLLPDMEPQAAIVNFYCPGDTLSMHRDMAEEVDKSLVSLSIGCDCIFLVGLCENPDSEDLQAPPCVALRLRSGDAVYMTGESRYAWHGVPKIIPGTCPGYLNDWPADFPAWRGFMKNKRVNFNVRQMR